MLKLFNTLMKRHLVRKAAIEAGFLRDAGS